MPPQDHPAPKDYKGVTVSSTFTDLIEHRAVLIKAIKGQGLTDVAMENDSAKPHLDVLESSLQMVRDGSAYVGVISHKYGQVPKCPTRNPGGLSLTEMEFNEARHLNRPILLFIMGDEHPVRPRDVETDGEKIKKLIAFRDAAKVMKADSNVHRVYATFDSLEQFKEKAIHAVADLRRHLDEREKGSPPAPIAATLPAPTYAPFDPAGSQKNRAELCVAAYLKRLTEETRFLPMIGLGKNLQTELEIKDAYVPLRTVLNTSMEDRRFGRFSKEQLEQAGPIEEDIVASEIFAVAARYNKRGVILLGEPGAGKTTGVRQLCWLLAGGQNSPKDLGLPEGAVPVFLPLRKLQSDDVEKTFKDFVVRATRGENAPEDQVDPGPKLWNRNEPILWVFDGLDEVVSEPVRIKACRNIQEFLKQRPKDYVLVTSRYQGYASLVDLGGAFLQFHVQPLNSEQVGAFVERWFYAVHRQLHGGRPGRGADPGADTAALVQILNQSDYTIGGLRELRTNPLLLTVVCLVYHQEHALPRGRATLYQECVKVLLQSWRKEVYIQQRGIPFDPSAAQRVLAHLAWWMHCQGESGPKDSTEGDRRGSPSAEVTAMAGAVAQSLAQTPAKAGLGRNPKRFVERMRDESGILVSASPGCCSFLHLTFQEYLAAVESVAQGRACELADRISQSWWREVILLALALGTDPFIKEFYARLLAAPDWDADASLTARCLDENAKTILDPFLAKLRSPTASDIHKVRILRLLRQNDDPTLLAVCKELADHKVAAIALAAREILERSKVSSASSLASLPPGGVHVDRRSGIAFVLVPGGEFEMGSLKGGDNEKPVHQVRISPFLLGRYPVTNQEYERFLKETNCQSLPSEWNNKNFNQPQQPVVGVSWDDAQAFCQWAGCRLPTEAEWEYACRAGTKTEFSFGDSLSSTQANFDGNHPYGQAQKGPYLQKTSPVCAYEPNRFGLFDMHGNVWEWCQDWYGGDYYKHSPKADPKGPDKGAARVLRGGCWGISGEGCRSAYRNFDHPSYRYYGIGFRAALSPRSVP